MRVSVRLCARVFGRCWTVNTNTYKGNSYADSLHANNQRKQPKLNERTNAMSNRHGFFFHLSSFSFLFLGCVSYSARSNDIDEQSSHANTGTHTQRDRLNSDTVFTVEFSLLTTAHSTIHSNCHYSSHSHTCTCTPKKTDRQRKSERKRETLNVDGISCAFPYTKFIVAAWNNVFVYSHYQKRCFNVATTI